MITSSDARLDYLVRYNYPKYTFKTNGELEIVNSEEYNKLFNKYIEEISNSRNKL